MFNRFTDEYSVLPHKYSGIFQLNQLIIPVCLWCPAAKNHRYCTCVIFFNDATIRHTLTSSAYTRNTSNEYYDFYFYFYFHIHIQFHSIWISCTVQLTVYFISLYYGNINCRMCLLKAIWYPLLLKQTHIIRHRSNNLKFSRNTHSHSFHLSGRLYTTKKKKNRRIQIFGAVVVCCPVNTN